MSHRRSIIRIGLVTGYILACWIALFPITLYFRQVGLILWLATLVVMIAGVLLMAKEMAKNEAK